MSRPFDISESEMLGALERSGYLLESEISKLLANSGFFVESNQVVEDSLTGKSREIDILAEYHRMIEDRIGFQTACKVKFVFEIKNNLYPIVLLTKFEFSPNIEDWTGLKEALTIPDNSNLQYDWYDTFYKELIEPKRNDIYTQYCSFQKKKANDELMALHPDNIHAGLSKITHYCEEEVKLWDKNLIYEREENDEDEEHEERYFRHFLFMPVLLINDELFELKDNELNRVDSSILVYNYHYKGEPKMAYVFVVTKKGFPEFIEKVVKIEDETEQKMIELKKGIA